ncbi:MAG: ABC transporter ATP-binding protein [Saprospiraceae bacterium]|nr:ABC transporter ATP-binding protein [Saprospiraceae bacterium]
MEISLANAGKRYRLDWIFRGLNYTFRSGERYAVLGPNGSGKSTLLKVLSGHLSLSKGAIAFQNGGRQVPEEKVFQQISYAAPYIELIEEFTLEESLKFHARLRPLLPGMTPARLYELLELPRARTKEIRFFSSGMKQRLKLALAVCSDTPALLLDEPTTNLDLNAISWYQNLVREYTGNRLVILASNDPVDAAFCGVHLNILDYKQAV